jgi:hypothetical protein
VRRHDDAVVQLGVWKARLGLETADGTGAEDGAWTPTSRHRTMDFGRVDRPMTMAVARQDHPSNGGRDRAGKMRKGRRASATKLRQPGARAG